MKFWFWFMLAVWFIQGWIISGLVGDFVESIAPMWLAITVRVAFSFVWGVFSAALFWEAVRRWLGFPIPEGWWRPRTIRSNIRRLRSGE